MPTPEPAAGAGEASPDFELRALVDSIDAELKDPVPGAPAPGSALAISLERELAGMFAMIGEGAGTFLPSIKVVLDESACKSLGDALAPVARKYGIARYIEGFQWRVELQALFVVVPIAIAIKGAIAHDLDRYRKAAAARPGAAPGAGLGDAPAGPAAPPAAGDKSKVEKLEPVST